MRYWEVDLQISRKRFAKSRQNSRKTERGNVWFHAAIRGEPGCGLLVLEVTRDVLEGTPLPGRVLDGPGQPFAK